MKTSGVLAGTRVEQVAEALRSDILSGRTPPGNRLASIDELAGRFEASRAVVREALRGLSEQRLVEIRHGDGTFASRPQIEDVANSLALLLHLSEEDQDSLLLSLMEVREAIEPLAARLAADRASAADLAEIARAMEHGIKAAEAGDHEAAIERDMLFHAAIGRASHNPLLSMLIDVIAPLLREQRVTALKAHERQRMTLRAHRAIARALAARDAEAAEREALKHIRDVNAIMRRRLMRVET